ncbi:hypothetical protein FBEOM_2 [Fusarium beomiforme]|uniref:F-box domain-containing protein n=1 Tax=Fusarium beomiforme TaxID=44412 RepID=A0A9P5AVZ0_9HYPO|nr:hypothetical protein FBEOM_2 [Fusarium beomiforme]
MLLDFPNEIQCQVIRLLDPIGLMSLSLANRHFRGLINPQRKHLGERLLQLELLPEHGGIIPIFRSLNRTLDPSWHDEAWEFMRWACTDCLRLLSHKHFDNHSLLRLGFRKPRPDSHAASMITSWEPLSQCRPKNCMVRSSEKYHLEKSRRAIYFFAVTKGVADDIRGDPAEHLDNLDFNSLVGFAGLFKKDFRNMNDKERLELFDGIAVLIESDDCGKKRHLRKCNECRFRKGLLYTQFQGSRGTRQFPIVPSRNAAFGTDLDRSFPGFLNTLNTKKPSVKLPLSDNVLYAMHMARCTRCEWWQEIRSFRVAGLYVAWTPTMSREPMVPETNEDKSLCNRCIVDTRGRGYLADSLSKWLVSMLNERLACLSHLLSQLSNFHRYTRVQHLSEAQTAECRIILQKMPWYGIGPKIGLPYQDFDFIDTRRIQWIRLLDRAKESDTEKSKYKALDELYDDWIRSSDAIEQLWRWLMACKEEVKDNPELLVDWALNRDGAAFE